jgi:hypothetical protein
MVVFLVRYLSDAALPEVAAVSGTELQEAHGNHGSKVVVQPRDAHPQLAGNAVDNYTKDFCFKFS